MNRYNNRIFPALLSIYVFCALGLRAEERPIIASLHPLITEMVQKISGESFQINELMGPTQSPHSFDPKPQDLLSLQDVRLVLSMGKGLESYLDRIQDNLQPGVEIFEIGKKIPSLLVSEHNSVFVCCPVHSAGAIDPHWWHNPQNMRRAVRYLNKELSALIPKQKEQFKENTQVYMKELEELDDWVAKGLKLVPKDDRKLVTAHAAFGYFCEAYGFKAIAVQGLTKEQSPSPSYLKETINKIRKEKIKAIFAEHDANPKIIEAIHNDTGVRIGNILLADNLGHQRVSYRMMIESNVRSIITAIMTPLEIK